MFGDGEDSAVRSEIRQIREFMQSMREVYIGLVLKFYQ